MNIEMKLNTDLWHENARAMHAQRIARSNARQRALFPWLLLLTIAAIAYLILWMSN